MKNSITNIIFLLLTISVNAQLSNSAFHNAVDSINAILKVNQLAYYTDYKQNSAFIKQISVNENGIVRFTDSIAKPENSTTGKKQELLPDCCPKKTTRTLDLSAIKKWDIDFPTAYLKDKNNQTYGRIIGIRKPDLYKLKEQFDKLTALYKKEETGSEYLLRAPEKPLTKQEAIDFIKSYYADFSTSSDQYSYDYGFAKAGYERPFRKFTANYKVEINDCTFKMTFDTYRWPYQEMKGTTVLVFDLSEIDSIERGANELLELSDQPGHIVVINAVILFHFKKNKNATVLHKEEKEELLEKADQVNLKIYEDPDDSVFTDKTIVKAFERLRELCTN